MENNHPKNNEPENSELNSEFQETNHQPGPWKIFVGIFLILIVTIWLVPYYGIKQNPEPNYLPSIEELNIPQLVIPNVESKNIKSNNIKSYIQTTPDIKKIADQIISLSCKETHRICNAKAIFYFVQNNFKYLNDPLAYEYFKTPQESFLSNTGDCDDSSILLSSLLQSVGFQTRFVFVPGHVYVQVKIPEAKSSYKEENDWINIDSTCQGCKFGEVHYKYVKEKKEYLN
jgi:transglutaminase-like putative cysteine protease